MISNILQQIDTNIAKHKANTMRNELEQMNKEMLLFELQIRDVNSTYRKLLMKDAPVGSTSNAIRNLRRL